MLQSSTNKTISISDFSSGTRRIMCNSNIFMKGLHQLSLNFSCHDFDSALKMIAYVTSMKSDTETRREKRSHPIRMIKVYLITIIVINNEQGKFKCNRWPRELKSDRQVSSSSLCSGCSIF